jgi:glycine oxidase
VSDLHAFDVVIVGAGVIGLSIAYELLCRGKRVGVLERERPGAGASSVAAGMLAPASEADESPPALSTFALESAARYPDFVRRLEATSGVACHLRFEGTLWVALDRDDVAELDRLHAIQSRRGFASSRLSGAEVRKREPGLTPRAVAGLWAERDVSVDPRALVAALVSAIEKLGGRIERGTVESLAPVVGGICLRGRRHDDRAFDATVRTVVLAAGAWSTAGLRSPVEHVGVRPVKGQVVRLRGAPLVSHCIRTPRVYIVPRSDGEIVIGATSEERGFDLSTNAGAVRDLLRRAWEVLPGIDELAIEELCVGFRPAVRDHLPVLGTSGIDGLYLATGHHRHGILLAPATAQELAELITTGQPRPLLFPFHVERLRGGPQ